MDLTDDLFVVPNSLREVDGLFTADGFEAKLTAVGIRDRQVDTTVFLNAILDVPDAPRLRQRWKQRHFLYPFSLGLTRFEPLLFISRKNAIDQSRGGFCEPNARSTLVGQ
jgi:hypothetical protein